VRIQFKNLDALLRTMEQAFAESAICMAAGGYPFARFPVSGGGRNAPGCING
jgi:hypothetical protein